ncbi:hypothetical protein ACFWNN_42510 [Lentzea sp. NPDC058450]|uniref:hypothetical protein n=1 Tax=Lentzea sp. NPDC058450 TaxID=3346505 RepID=UPI003668C6D4
MPRPVDETLEVHQILFGPGPNGVEPIASTFAWQDGLGPWSNRLLPLCRLESYPDQEVPRTSLSYFSFSEEHAAVLRRIDNGHTKSRGHAHALVGRPDLLTPERAVALAGWSGWLDRAQADPSNSFPAVVIPAAGHHFRVAKPDAIASLLAALLRQPTGNLTVCGAPDSDRIPLIRDCLRVAGALFSGSDIRRKWTFSTYEQTVVPSTKTAAEIVFLPGILEGITQVAGTVVDLGDATTDDAADRIALMLAETYVAQGMNAIDSLLFKHSVADRPALQDRIALLGSLFDVSAQTPRVKPVEPVDPPLAGMILTITSSESPGPIPAPEGPSPLEIAQELRRADDPGRTAELVGLLCDLVPPESAAVRSRMRSQLLDAHFTTERVDIVAQHAQGAYRAILTHCLGRHLEDLTPRDHPTLAAVCGIVSRHKTSPGLVKELVNQATRTGKITLLLAALGLRDLRGQGSPGPEPAWDELFCADPAAHHAAPAAAPQSSPPRQRGARSHQAESHGGDYRLVLFVSAVLIFLLGLVVGVVA